jgi:toxin CptA
MVHASLQRSRTIAVSLCLAHTAAGVILVLLDVPVWSKVALAFVLVLSVLHATCRHALLRTNRAVLGIEIKDRETAAVLCRDGRWRDARVLGSTYVTPLLTVLNLRLTGERLMRHVVLVPDNIDREDFRKVRVLLRWSRVPRVDRRE